MTERCRGSTVRGGEDSRSMAIGPTVGHVPPAMPVVGQRSDGVMKPVGFRVRAPMLLVQGWTRAMTFGAQPNQRLKLPAPLVTGCGLRPGIRWYRIPFVNTSSLRRSLSAIR